MEREDNCKNKIENLKRNPQSPKNVGRNGDPVNLVRLQLAEKLVKSTQRKCQELEEVVARLIEEKRVLTDRVELAEEKSDRIFTANLKMTNEKNNSITELENKIKESERLTEFFREKCMCLDTKIAKMDQELEDLKQRKSESDQVVEELKLANKTIQELKWEKMESDKKAELLESTLENRLSDMQLLLSAHKSSRSSPPAAAGNIIHSDDEIKADGVSCFVLQPEAIVEAVKQPVTREAKKRISEKPNETDVASKRKKSSPENNALPATSATSKSNVERKSEASKEKEDDDAFEPEEQIPLKKRLRSNSLKSDKAKKTAKTSEKKRLDHQEDGSETVKDKEFFTHMSPVNIFNLIPRLTDEQRIAVRDIGFGGVLNIRIEENKSDILSFILKNFDCSRCSIKLDGDEIIMGEEDVESVFDLPRGERPVIESMGRAEKDVDNGYAEFLENWRSRWTVPHGGLTANAMVENLKNRRDSGDDFKRDFVVLVVGTLLSGLHDPCVNYKVLYSLRDVNEIRNLNWCNYTFRSLISSVAEWKNGNASFFKGPTTLLMLTYLDRMEFKVRTEPREFPVCANWNSDLVKKRIAEEKKAGGFGKGKSVPVLKRRANRNVPNSNEPSNSITNEESKRKSVRAIVKMINAVTEFIQVMSETGKQDLIAGVFRRAFGILLISEESTKQTTKEKKTQIATEKKRQEVVFASNNKLLSNNTNDGSK